MLDRIKEAKRKLGKGTKKMLAKAHKKNLTEHQLNLMAVTKERETVEKKLTANTMPELDNINKKMKQLTEAVTFKKINEGINDIKKWKETKSNADQLAALVPLAAEQENIQQRWQTAYTQYQTELKALESLVTLQIENKIAKLTEKDHEKNKDKIANYKEMLEKVKKHDLTNFEKYIDDKSGIKKINGLKTWFTHAKDIQSFENKMKNVLASEAMLALTSQAHDIDTFATKLKTDLRKKMEFIKKEVPKAEDTDTFVEINQNLKLIDSNIQFDISVDKQFKDVLQLINKLKGSIETREKMIAAISDLSNHPDMLANETQLKTWTKKLNALARDNLHDQTIFDQLNKNVNDLYEKAIDQCVKNINDQIAYHDLSKDKLTTLKAIPGMSDYLASHADQTKKVNEIDAQINRELQIKQLIADAKKNPVPMMTFLNNAENKAYLSTLKDTERFNQFYDLFYQETLNHINKNVDNLVVGAHKETLENMQTLLREQSFMDEEKQAAIENSIEKINKLEIIETKYNALVNQLKVQLQLEVPEQDVKVIDSLLNQTENFISVNKKFLIANNLLNDLNVKLSDLERQKIGHYNVNEVHLALNQIETKMKELNDPCHVKLQMLLGNGHIQTLMKTNKTLEERIISLSNQSSDLMANTLTANNKKIFESLDPYELLRDPAKEPTPTITAYSQFFNKTGAFIISDILSRKSIDERTLAIEYWISVAEKSLTDPLIKDVNLAFNICGSLNNSSISRLKSSWDGISSHAKETMQYLNYLTDPESSAKNAREYMQDYPDSIPYLGNFISDFTNVREGGNTELVELIGIQGFELAYHQFSNIASKQKQSNLIKVKHPGSGLVIDAIQNSNRDEKVEYKISKDLESSEEDKRPEKSYIMSSYKNLYVPDNRSSSAIEQTLLPIDRAKDNVIILNKDNLDFLPNLRQAGFQVGIITDGIDESNIPNDAQFKISTQAMQTQIDATVKAKKKYYSTHKFELYSLVTYGVVLPDTAINARIAEQIKKMDTNEYFEKLKPAIINNFIIEQIASQAGITKNNTMLMDVYAKDFLLNKRRHGLNQNDLVHDNSLKKGMAILYLLQYEPHLFDPNTTDKNQKLRNENHIEIVKRYLSTLEGDDLKKFYDSLNRPIHDNKKVIDIILSNNLITTDLKSKFESLYDRADFSLKRENQELKTNLETSYMALKNYKDEHDGLNQGSDATRKGRLARSIWVGLNGKPGLNEKIDYLKGQLENNTQLYMQDDKMKKIPKSIKKEPTLVRLIRETINSLENYAKAEQAFLMEQSNQRKIKARQESPLSPRQEPPRANEPMLPRTESPRVESPRTMAPEPALSSPPREPMPPLPAEPMTNLPPLPAVPEQRPEIDVPPVPEAIIADLPKAPDATKERIAEWINTNLGEVLHFNDPTRAGQDQLKNILEDIIKIYHGILEAKTKEEMLTQQIKLNKVTTYYTEQYASEDWNKIAMVEKHLQEQQAMINQKNIILPHAPKPHTSTFFINGTLVDDKKTLQESLREGMKKAVKQGVKQTDKMTQGIKNIAQDLNDKRKNINITLPKPPEFKAPEFKLPKMPTLKLPKFKLPIILSSREKQYPRIKDENDKKSLISRGKNFLSKLNFSRKDKFQPEQNETTSLLDTSTFFAHDELSHEVSKPTRPTIEVRDAKGNMLSLSETQEAYQGKKDYSAYRSDLNIGFSEFCGSRKEGQEDRVIVSALKNCEDLSNNDMKELLKKSVDEANTQCGQEQEQGSTLVAAVVHQDHIYTANVGDSSNYLITVDSLGTLEAKRLNKNLHRPMDEGEYDYIINNGGTVTAMGNNGRLNNELALSRAIGDQKHGNAINPTPDIIDHKINIPPGGYAFMITCCDGLTEGHDVSAFASECYVRDLAIKCIKEEGINPSTDPGKFAQALAKRAIEEGSNDNVSVVVTPLQQKDATSKMVAVFDGHGGSKVSQALHDNFERIMNEKVAELKVKSGVRLGHH